MCRSEDTVMCLFWPFILYWRQSLLQPRFAGPHDSGHSSVSAWCLVRELGLQTLPCWASHGAWGSEFGSSRLCGRYLTHWAIFSVPNHHFEYSLFEDAPNTLNQSCSIFTLKIILSDLQLSYITLLCYSSPLPIFILSDIKSDVWIILGLWHLQDWHWGFCFWSSNRTVFNYAAPHAAQHPVLSPARLCAGRQIKFPIS